MTPYEIELILHFHCRVGLPDKPPIYEQTVAMFREHGLVEAALTHDGRPSYKTTEKGADYVRRLTGVPIPLSTCDALEPSEEFDLISDELHIHADGSSTRIIRHQKRASNSKHVCPKCENFGYKWIRLEGGGWSQHRCDCGCPGPTAIW